MADATALRSARWSVWQTLPIIPLSTRNYPGDRAVLFLAASAQLPEHGSLEANVTPADRCTYFLDVSIFSLQTRAIPGYGGGAAMGGVQSHARVPGTSDQCIADLSGRFAQP